MNTDALYQHPFPHDGVSRRRRLAEALLPAYAPVDGRRTEDLLAYAREYARLLQYTDLSGRPAGDWSAFFDGDPSVIAAMLLTQEDAQAYPRRFHALLDEYERHGATALGRASLKGALLLLLEMARKLLGWQAKAVPGLALARELGRLLPSVAGDAFCRLLAYLHRAEALGLIAPGLPLDRYEAEWPLQEPPRSFAPFAQGLPTEPEALFREIFSLRQLFKKLYEPLAATLAAAPRYLEETLSQYPAHEPHIALFLAAVQLMGLARQDMNRLTQRHLDFYYQEVLGMRKLPARPDQAHLVLELAQGFVNGLLETSDRFLDGKDASGQDILFAPDEELVLSPAALDPEQGLKTLFLQKTNRAQAGQTPVYEIENTYGSPDADGDARKSADGKWFPLGTAQDPAARFGFAIASPMFLLAEGEREVELRFHLKGLGEILETYSLSRVIRELERNVQIYYSAEKTWIEIEDKSVAIDQGEESLSYRLALSADQEAVIPYHAGLAGQMPVPDALSTTHPVLAFVFDNYGLSVEGDPDLSLEGDLAAKIYNANQFYLTGEYLFSDSNFTQLYVAQAQVIGVDPGVNKPIWEQVTGALVAASAVSSFPHMATAGAFITYNAARYRANVSGTLPGPPDPSDPAQLIWRPLANIRGLFDPEVSDYAPGDIVEDADSSGQAGLYVAGTGVQPIAPNLATAAWKQVAEGTVPGNFEQATARFFRFDSGFYRLNVAETATGPNTSGGPQPLIWDDAGIESSAGFALPYAGGDLVFYTADSHVYLLKSASNPSRTTYAPPGTPVSGTTANVIWRQIAPFNPASSYTPYAFPYVLHPSLSNSILKANVDIQSSTFGSGASSFDNTAIINPAANGGQNRVWQQVLTYASTAGYAAGTFVRRAYPVPGPDKIFYAKNAVAAGDDPDSSTSGNWALVGNVGGTIGEQWGNTSNSYSFGAIVSDSVTYFAASVQTQPSHKPSLTDNTLNPLLWDPKFPADHDASKEYEALPAEVGDNCAKEGTNFYFAQYANRNINPNLASVWEDQGVLNVYDPAQPYNPDDWVRIGTTQFFVCQAVATGVDPLSAQSIWSEYPAVVGAYDSTESYPADTITIWKNLYYYSLAPVVRFSPATAPNANAWTPLSASLSEFESGVLYAANSVVRYGSQPVQYVQAQLAVQDIHPALGLTIWEQVPDPIPAYAEGTLFGVGYYVRYQPSAGAAHFYRACAANQNVAPDAGLMVWREEASIVIEDFPFTGTVPPAGSYVRYGDKLFRLLTGNPTALPGTDPTQWQPVGLIRFHNPAVQWYKNMHVRDAMGNVYRARVDVPLRTDLSDEAYWEIVSGSYPYKYFLGPCLIRLQLDVRVEGMRNLILENDQGVLNAAKPFLPFGALPLAGSRFYIGSYEAFSKSLQSVELQAEWGNLPADFKTHYDQYMGSNVNSDDYFKASASLLEEFDWEAAPVDSSFELFVPEGQSSLSAAMEYAFSVANYPRSPDLKLFTSTNPVPRRGFLTLKLNQHFFHEVYPKILAKVALTLPATPDNIPNPPYTPLINSLTLSYSARETLVFQDKTKGDFEDRVEQFFHLHPYGWSEFVPVDPALDDGQGVLASLELVPRYLAQAGDAEGRPLLDASLAPVLRDAAGSLFLGIAGLLPPQVLTVFCQVAEGSENPARDKRFVSWSYLADNRWKRFEVSQILSDDTNGLLRPGIVKLSVPSDATSANSLLPGGLFWLRASVSEDPDGVGQLYDLRLHAVKATFEDQGGNDLARLATPLPALSLSKLFFRKAVVKTVEQPFASFGGRVEEQDADFYMRVSERLRHKRRAVSIFDYERLVLAQFPQVYQVKCISHAQAIPQAGISDAKLHAALSSGAEHRPGQVQIVVLPDLRNQNAVDPLRPRVSNNLRDEIETYLQGLSSGFAQVSVENPLFEEVRVSARVALKPGKDPGLYLAQLNEDLIRYLSPWRFESEYDLHFGACLHISPLIDYMDQLGYVEYVEQVRLSVVIRDENDVEQLLVANAEEVCGHSSASVLVSAAQHSFQLIENLERC